MNGKPDYIEALRYDILNCETDEFKEASWQIENFPIEDETSGMVTFILFIARDSINLWGLQPSFFQYYIENQN